MSIEYGCCGQPVQELPAGEGRWLGCAVCKRAGYEHDLPKSDAEVRTLGLAGLLIRAGFKARLKIRREPALPQACPQVPGCLCPVTLYG